MKIHPAAIVDPEAKFLQKVVKIIHENISNHSFGAAQLAHQLKLSESQVYRKLKAISGKSTAVFIRSIRLQKGKELIPFGRIINELNWQVKPKNRPEMIDRFERGESLFLEDCKARFSD